MSKLFVEFSDFSPTVVEGREVASTSVQGLTFPDDAVSFVFMDSDLNVIVPRHWITETVDKGSLDTMRQRYPDAGPMFQEHGEKVGVTEYGLVTWNDADGKYHVQALMPICADFAFVARKSGEVVYG